MKESIEDFLFKWRKIGFLLLAILSVLNLVFFLNPQLREATRYFGKPLFDVMTTETDDVMTTDDVRKLYPEWVVANFSRDFPVTRNHSQDPNSTWTALDGNFPRGLVWPQPQNQQNVENKVC